MERIFCQVFKINDIDLNTSIDNIDNWDSLGHMNLIAAIEKEFSVHFSFQEIIELSSVAKIIDNLKRKHLL